MNGHPNIGEFLLDSCVLVWLVLDQSKLSSSAQEAINKAPKLYVSPISAWELTLKEKKGLLHFSLPMHQWWATAIEKHNLTELPLKGNSAIRSAELPLLHSDPADRLLIATAEAEGLVIITPDHQIQRYPFVKTLW